MCKDESRMKWAPDTCNCVVECQAPSKKGTFIQRCRVHENSRNTTDVYAHNLTHRKRGSESEDQAQRRKEQTRKATETR